MSNPIVIGNGDVISVEERITGALLGIHFVMRDGPGSEADAFAMLEALRSDLLHSHVYDSKKMIAPVAGVPRWLAKRFASDDEDYATQLYMYADSLNRPVNHVTDFIEALQAALADVRPLPEITEGDRQAAKQALAAFSGIGSVDPTIDREASRRRVREGRIDIPVVEGTNGTLLTADLQFGPEDITWPVFELAKDQVRRDRDTVPTGNVDKNFREGVQRGYVAARKLLLKLGKDAQNVALDPKLNLRNILAPASLVGGSVALPVAIGTLRRGLGLGMPSAVVSGDMTRDGDFVLPIDGKDAAHAWAKLQAVRDDGSFRRLVAVTRTDHGLDGLDAIVAEHATLEAVARKLWGHDFDRQVGRAAEKRLRDVGLFVGWNPATLPGKNDIFVRTDQADELERLLLDAKAPRAVHVGGPARSGKTWIAHDVVTRLRQAEGWDVQVLRFDPARDDIDADALGEGLMGVMDLFPQAARRLIVLDDVRYGEKLKDFPQKASHIAKSLGVHLLVVRQSDLSSDWLDPNGPDLQSIFTPDDLRQFVEALANQHPEAFAEQDITPEVFVEDYAVRLDQDASRHAPITDLHWICKSVQTGYDLERYRDFLLRDVSEADAEADQLRMLAYATLYGIGCETKLIENISRPTRDRFRIFVDEGKIARIQQPLAAQLALWDPGGNEHHYLEQSEGAEAIAPIVRHVIDSSGTSGRSQASRAERLIAISTKLRRSWLTTYRLIFRGSRRSGERQPAKLDPADIEALVKLNFARRPGEAARIVLTFHEVLSTQDRLYMLESFVGRMSLAAQATRLSFTCAEMTSCFCAVLACELDFHGEGQRPHEKLHELWRGFLDRAARDHLFSKIFAHEDDPFQRLRLLAVMLQLDMPEVFQEAAAALPSWKDGIGKLEMRRFRYLGDLRKTVFDSLLVAEQGLHRDDRAIDERSDGRGWTSELVDEFDTMLDEIDEVSRAEGSQVFGKREIATLEEFGDWMTLMLELDAFRIEDDAAVFARIFDRLAGQASTGEIVSVVGRVHHQNIPAATHLIRESRTFQGPGLLAAEKASLSDVANLLFGLGRWNVQVLQTYLWRAVGGASAQPNRQLASDLADRVRAEGDLRNAGRILRAAGQYDVLFASDPAEGFGAVFLNAVGLDWLKRRIGTERRSALLVHLVQGLTQIDHPWLGELRDVIVDHLRSSLADGRFQQWGARLCVTLLSDEVARPIFERVLLSDRTMHPDNVLVGMENAVNVEALEAYHALGRMHPDICDDFVHRNPPAKFAAELAEMLAAPHRGEQALRVIQAVGKTYRQVDPTKAGIYVQSFPWDNLRKALRAARAGSVSDALRILAQLNHEETIDLIGSKTGQSILGFKLRLTLRSPQAAAAILYRCERIQEGLGRELLSRQPSNYKSILVREVGGLQNPRSYAATAYMLEEVDPTIGNHSRTFFRVWIGQLKNLRSPAALVAILRLLEKVYGLGKSQAFPRAVETIDVDAIANRLNKRAALEDLAHAPALAELLYRGGAKRQAGTIAQALAGIPSLERKLDVARFESVLRMFEALVETVPADLDGRLRSRLVEMGSQPVLIDPVSFWQTFGRFALKRYEMQGQKWQAFDAPPPTLKTTIDPATRIIALLAHVEANWVKRLLDQSWNAVAADPAIVPQELLQQVANLCPDKLLRARLDHRAGPGTSRDEVVSEDLYPPDRTPL